MDEENTYNLVKLLAEATDIPGDKIYTDPATVPPPQPQPDPTLMAVEIENKKADNEATDEARKADLEKYKVDEQNTLDKYKADLNAELQIALAQIKNNQQFDLEKFKASMKDAPVKMANESIDATGDAVRQLTEMVQRSIVEVSQAFDRLKASSDAEKELVRDAAGRVTGVRKKASV